MGQGKEGRRDGGKEDGWIERMMRCVMVAMVRVRNGVRAVSTVKLSRARGSSIRLLYSSRAANPISKSSSAVATTGIAFESASPSVPDDVSSMPIVQARQHNSATMVAQACCVNEDADASSPPPGTLRHPPPLRLGGRRNYQCPRAYSGG